SKDVLLLKENFEARASDLSKKIEAETTTLADKLEHARESVLEKVEVLFDRKFLRIVGVLIGAAPVMYAGLVFLQDQKVDQRSIAFIALVSGVVILTLTYLLTSRRRST